MNLEIEKEEEGKTKEPKVIARDKKYLKANFVIFIIIIVLTYNIIKTTAITVTRIEPIKVFTDITKYTCTIRSCENCYQSTPLGIGSAIESTIDTSVSFVSNIVKPRGQTPQLDLSPMVNSIKASLYSIRDILLKQVLINSLLLSTTTINNKNIGTISLLNDFFSESYYDDLHSLLESNIFSKCLLNNKVPGHFQHLPTNLDIEKKQPMLKFKGGFALNDDSLLAFSRDCPHDPVTHIEDTHNQIYGTITIFMRPNAQFNPHVRQPPSELLVIVEGEVLKRSLHTTNYGETDFNNELASSCGAVFQEVQLNGEWKSRLTAKKQCGDSTQCQSVPSNLKIINTPCPAFESPKIVVAYPFTEFLERLSGTVLLDEYPDQINFTSTYEYLGSEFSAEAICTQWYCKGSCENFSCPPPPLEEIPRRVRFPPLMLKHTSFDYNVPNQQKYNHGSLPRTDFEVFLYEKLTKLSLDSQFADIDLTKIEPKISIQEFKTSNIRNVEVTALFGKNDITCSLLTFPSVDVLTVNETIYLQTNLPPKQVIHCGLYFDDGLYVWDVPLIASFTNTAVDSKSLDFSKTRRRVIEGVGCEGRERTPTGLCEMLDDFIRVRNENGAPSYVPKVASYVTLDNQTEIVEALTNAGWNITKLTASCDVFSFKSKLCCPDCVLKEDCTEVGCTESLLKNGLVISSLVHLNQSFQSYRNDVDFVANLTIQITEIGDKFEGLYNSTNYVQNLINKAETLNKENTLQIQNLTNLINSIPTPTLTYIDSPSSSDSAECGLDPICWLKKLWSFILFVFVLVIGVMVVFYALKFIYVFAPSFSTSDKKQVLKRETNQPTKSYVDDKLPTGLRKRTFSDGLEEGYSNVELTSIDSEAEKVWQDYKLNPERYIISLKAPKNESSVNITTVLSGHFKRHSIVELKEKCHSESSPPFNTAQGGSVEAELLLSCAAHQGIPTFLTIDD